MHTALRATAALCLAASLAAPGPARAADAPTIDAALDAVRTFVRERKWQEGADAVRTLLDARAEDPDMRPRIGEAEDLLRRCRFGLSGWTLDPARALGRGAVKFVPSTRAVEIEVDPKTAAGWSRRADFSRTLDLPFEGDVTVEMPWADAANWAVLLVYDPVARTGLRFEVRPGDHCGGAGRIVRMDDDGASKDLAGVASPKVGREPKTVRVARAGSMVQVHGDRTQLAQAVFVGERRGLVGLRPAADVADGAPIPAVRITGKIDPRFAKKVIAGAETEAFRVWSGSAYRRADALPRWVLDLERTSGAWADRIPEVPEAARAAYRDAVRAFFDEDGATLRARNETLADVELPDAARTLLEALVAAADGRVADAETKLSAVRDADPKSGVVAAAFAVCARRRGAEDEAIDRAAAASAIDAAFAPVHDLRAEIAFRRGDIAAMQAALDDAARAATASRRTVDLRERLLRIRRGPPWTKRLDRATEHVTAAADGDKAGCAAVAQFVEAAVADFGARFRKVPAATHLRVLVFADDALWLTWGAERGLDVDGLAAAYDPTLREIGVLAPGDVADSVSRLGPGGAAHGELRAATFRACLHREVDDAPAWLDTGGGRWFADEPAAPPNGKPAPADAPMGAAREATLLARYSRRFVPLRDLFLADRAVFDEAADVLGVQSWTIVRALRETQDAPLRETLDLYVAALVRGAGRDAPFREVLEPRAAQIEAAISRRAGGAK